MRKLILVLLMLLIAHSSFALEGDFSQVKTDEQEQWGVTGRHKMKVGNLSIGIGGKYFKISDKPAQWSLGANTRFSVIGGIFGEIETSIHDTHDTAAGGVGYTVHKMLSVSGAYAREYDSAEFDRVLQGQAIDLLQLSADGKAQVRPVALEYGISYVSDYDSDSDRVDGYIRARVDLTVRKKFRLYLGAGFERIRYRDFQRIYVRVSL